MLTRRGLLGRILAPATYCDYRIVVSERHHRLIMELCGRLHAESFAKFVPSCRVPEDETEC